MTDDESRCDCVFEMVMAEDEAKACLWLHDTLRSIAKKKGGNAERAVLALCALSAMARQIELLHRVIHLMEETSRKHGVDFEFAKLSDLLAKLETADTGGEAN